ncbi:hypothetical protein [Haloarcula montana]|uniref:hypothetical protein n=1 Tax=Haloarcula montana TaxID=3111776 RepID=UPI002D76733F|nr:hypothetical protein [Haloarcula sp. GH36]
MTQTNDAVDVTRMSLRDSGWIGYTDDAVYIERDGEKIQIDNEHVRKVTLQSLRWDLAIMSALLIGIGGYVAITRNPLVGIAFAAVGVLSMYRTYGNRYALRIQVENESKPVTVYPTYPVECHETIVDSIEDRSHDG